MGTQLVLPDKGVRVTVVAHRAGTPRLLHRGEFVKAGHVTTDFGLSSKEYIQLRRQVGLTEQGAPIYKMQQIPAVNVQRIMAH